MGDTERTIFFVYKYEDRFCFALESRVCSRRSGRIVARVIKRIDLRQIVFLYVPVASLKLAATANSMYVLVAPTSVCVPQPPYGVLIIFDAISSRAWE